MQDLVKEPYALDPCRAFPEAGVEVERSGEKGSYSVESGPWTDSKEGP